MNARYAAMRAVLARPAGFRAGRACRTGPSAWARCWAAGRHAAGRVPMSNPCVVFAGTLRRSPALHSTAYTLPAGLFAAALQPAKKTATADTTTTDRTRVL